MKTETSTAPLLFLLVPLTLEIMDKEKWKDIHGYIGLYQVSDLGFIKSLRNEIILKPGISHNGYEFVILNNKNRKNFRVNRLVALMFIPNPENKPYVNHKDGNKLNNYVENLEWCTSSHNAVHAYKLGLRKAPHKNKYYKNHPKSRLVNMYNLNDEFIRSFESLTQAMHITGCDSRRISDVCKGIKKSTKNHKFRYAS